MGVLGHGARDVVSGDGCWLMVPGVWCLVMGVLAHGARGVVSGDGCVGSWCQGYGVW